MRSIDADTYSQAVIEKVFALRHLLEVYDAKLPKGTSASFRLGIKLLLESVEEAHLDWLTYVQSSFALNTAVRDDHIRAQSKIALRILKNVHWHLLPYLVGLAT